MSNIRDLGGLPVRPGERVRTGLVFRSGAPANFTSRDVAAITALRLARVYDLRSSHERGAAPAAWLDALPVGRWQLAGAAEIGNPQTLAAECTISADATRSLMCEVYRRLPIDHRASFAALFKDLARGEMPVLIHCAAGKDRTGVAAALLLDALGVDREHIEADYLRTNETHATIRAAFKVHPSTESIAAFEPEVWEPMLLACPSYLAAMFEVVDARWGSGANYAVEALGLGSTGIADLRSKLIERCSMPQDPGHAHPPLRRQTTKTAH